MEFVKNKLACSHCAQSLESPVTLPCGETICKHHVKEYEKRYYCCACDIYHTVPKNGFKINRIIDDMLRSKIGSLHFGDEYQNAVNAVEGLEELMKSYRLLKQDPDFEIDKVIGEFDFRQLEETVKTISIEVENSKGELSVLEIDRQKWKVIKKKLDSRSRSLNTQFINARNKIFLDKLDLYQREKKLELFVRNNSSRYIDII
jgi:hypothetical protein